MQSCMTVAEAMEATGKGQDTIYRLLRNGTLVKADPLPRKRGKPITRITNTSIMNYIRSGREKA